MADRRGASQIAILPAYTERYGKPVWHSNTAIRVVLMDFRGTPAFQALHHLLSPPNSGGKTAFYHGVLLEIPGFRYRR
jgi:hypothetical protein